MLLLFWEVLLFLWKAITIAKKGKYQLLHLKQRYKRVAMPKVQIVDLKTEACPYGVFYLSQTLFTALAENLKAKKQSVIFLNRRGFASVIICEDCQNKMQFLVVACFFAISLSRKQKWLLCVIIVSTNCRKISAVKNASQKHVLDTELFFI